MANFMTIRGVLNSFFGIILGKDGNIIKTKDSSTISAMNNANNANVNLEASQLISTVTQGTAPLAVTSTSKVSNLNVDEVDGSHVNDSSITTDLWTASKIISYTGGLVQPTLDGHSVDKNSSSEVEIYGFSAATTNQLPQRNSGGNIAWSDSPTLADANITGLTSTVLGANTSVKSQIQAIANVLGDTKDPNGFVNRIDSTLSYNVSTRTFTVSGTFTYYNQGVKYVKNAVTENVVHADSTGLFYIYYSGSTLSVNAVNTPFDILTNTLVAMIIYNNTSATTFWAGKEGIVVEERHGIIMDTQTHLDLHSNIGTYILGSGFALNGTYTVASGTGGLIDTSYGVDSGVVADEDIQITLTSLTDNAGVGNQYPVFYRTGTATEWRWYVNNLPLLIDSGSNNIQYNQLNGSTWQLTPISSNGTYFNMYLCAIPFHSASSGNSYKFVWIIGQTTYSSLANAQAESILSLNLDGIPFSEIAPLWKITMRRENAYSTASGRSRIEGTQKVIGTKLTVSLTYNPQNHNNLSNRSDANSHPATAISTDTTNFNGVLSSSDTNVQLALDTIDNLTLGNISGTLGISKGGTNASSYTASQLLRMNSGNTAFESSGVAVNDSGTTTSDLWTASKIQTAINAVIGANDAMIYKGVIDCSGNPNYPAADAGHVYKISVAGKIGGGSGVNVEVGDTAFCCVDGTVAGTQTAVGANWNIVQANIDGAVITSDTSAIDGQIVLESGTSGKIIKKSLAAIDSSGSVNIPSGQKYKINNSNLAASDVGAEPTLTKGNLTEATSSILTISGGSSSVIGSGTSIQVKQSSTSQSGYLSSTDWNTFNGREPAISKNTAFNQNFETSTTNIKMDGAVSVGSLSTIARADHVHATDTSREPTISKNTAFNQNFETTTSNIKMNGAVSVGSLSTIARADHIHPVDTSREPTVTKGNLSEATSSILTISGGTGAVIGSGTSIQVKQASTSQSGYLSSTDWNTFNGKQASLGFTPVPDTRTVNSKALSANISLTASDVGAEPTLTKGNLSEVTSSVLTISGGTGAVIGSGLTIQVKQASSSQAGYLSASDWNTFNTASGSGVNTDCIKIMSLGGIGGW